MSKLHHTTPIEVKYRDADSVGHVSSPGYYDCLQHACIKYMFHLLQLPHEERLPHIMVKTACEYLKPARFGDSLTVRSSVTKFGTKSFELEYLMCLDKGDDADAEPEITRRACLLRVPGPPMQKNRPRRSSSSTDLAVVAEAHRQICGGML